jgi:hypothetical protein
LPDFDENATKDRPRRNKGCPMMAGNDGGVPPILAQKHYTEPSAFAPENLLREARRQKRITGSSIPEICVLDPDGDILRSLIAGGEARLEPGWACYHTQLQKPVLCFARVTNQMGRVDGDFEKGEADESHDALQLIAIAADRLRSRLPS